MYDKLLGKLAFTIWQKYLSEYDVSFKQCIVRLVLATQLLLVALQELTDLSCAISIPQIQDQLGLKQTWQHAQSKLE